MLLNQILLSLNEERKTSQSHWKMLSQRRRNKLKSSTLKRNAKCINWKANLVSRNVISMQKAMASRLKILSSTITKLVSFFGSSLITRMHKSNYILHTHFFKGQNWCFYLPDRVFLMKNQNFKQLKNVYIFKCRNSSFRGLH